MNARLRIYCIILAVAYVFILAFSIYDGSKSFIEEVKDGYNKGRQEKMNDKVTYSPIYYSIKLEPKEGYGSFPETEQNITTNNPIGYKIQTISAKTHYDNSHNIPAYLKVAEVIILLFGFFLFFGYIYIPFAFFSILRKVTKGDIMNNAIIKKSYIIGSILILSSLLEIAFATTQTAMAKHVMLFENYNIVYDFGFSTYSAFLLGLVIFIFAETLRMSLKMKEEQDLTI